MGMKNELENDLIEIPLSKLKLLFICIISLVFVVISFYLVISQQVSPIFRSHVFNTISGIAGILFFGLVFIFVLLKFRDKRPGVIIDKEGITINSGPKSFGLIKWFDIDHIEPGTYYNQSILKIFVKNPEYYVVMQNNLIARKGMEISWKYLGTPITISASGLKCNFEQLKNLILIQFRENYKKEID
jgi:hypothetical protein